MWFNSGSSWLTKMSMPSLYFCSFPIRLLDAKVWGLCIQQRLEMVQPEKSLNSQKEKDCSLPRNICSGIMWASSKLLYVSCSNVAVYIVTVTRVTLWSLTLVLRSRWYCCYSHLDGFAAEFNCIIQRSLTKHNSRVKFFLIIFKNYLSGVFSAFDDKVLAVHK